jgi:hypothetical protein
MNGKQALPPHPTTPVRVGVAPRGAHPPHPERFWVSNGFGRYGPRRRSRSALYLVLALIVYWGFVLFGAVMLLIVFGRWFWSS